MVPEIVLQLIRVKTLVRDQITLELAHQDNLREITTYMTSPSFFPLSLQSV